MSGDEIRNSLLAAQGGDRRALAQALTLVDRAGAKALQVSELLYPQGKALRVGITGPPGAGKSTLVGSLIPKLLKANLRIAVLAVDPSSPFSRGAILGDRIRYGEFVGDQRIFVRSIGTRGSLGGLSSSAYLMLRVFDACGFDLVIVETVGVGQTELDVMYVADDIAVVVVPESGDSIQAMKAGLMEIADVFVVNKGDRPGAESMVRELNWLSEGRSDQVDVFLTTATEGLGVDPLVNRWTKLAHAKLRASLLKGSRSPQSRLQHEALSLARGFIENNLVGQVAQVKDEASMMTFLKTYLSNK